MYQGQAKPIAGGSVGGILLIEFVENMPDVLLADPNAFVPNPYGDAAAPFFPGKIVPPSWLNLMALPIRFIQT